MVSFAIDTSEWNVRETIMVAKISIGLMAYMIYLGWKLHTHGRTIWLEYLEHGKRGILSRGAYNGVGIHRGSRAFLMEAVTCESLPFDSLYRASSIHFLVLTGSCFQGHSDGVVTTEADL